MCDIWELGDDIEVTYRRSKHFGRQGTIVAINESRLSVSFHDHREGLFVDKAYATLITNSNVDRDRRRRNLWAELFKILARLFSVLLSMFLDDDVVAQGVVDSFCNEMKQCSRERAERNAAFFHRQ